MKLLNIIVFDSLKHILRKTKIYKKYALSKGAMIRSSDVNKILNIAPPLMLEKTYGILPKIGIVKTHEIKYLEGFVCPSAAWLRYERFCRNNNIAYDFIDITKSNWIEEASKCDIIVCHTNTDPVFIEMVESKIYILEKVLNKFCFPSFHEIWQYENKNRSNYLYQCYNLPSIPTFTTNNKDEAYERINKSQFPIIFKNATGASSSGVIKIESKQYAEKLLKKVFGKKGLKTQYPYQKQKDYFYLQQFIDDATYDLRIMLVGNMAFGYYRYPSKGDFRASGSGLLEKKALPEDALLLAIDIRNKLNCRQMGVDLLYSEKHKQYYIIETSLFNRIDTSEQLVVDGVPGYYDITDIKNIQFKEGKFWVQELMLRYLINEWSIML